MKSVSAAIRQPNERSLLVMFHPLLKLTGNLPLQKLLPSFLGVLDKSQYVSAFYCVIPQLVLDKHAKCIHILIIA